MNKSTRIIEKVVQQMGGTIEDFVPERGCFYISIKGKRILLDHGVCITRQSFISAQLTKCKEITYKLLKDAGLPSPLTVCFYSKSYDKDQAIKKLTSLTYPIILKKAMGSNSIGIFPGIQSPKEAIRIIQKHLPRYKSMIAQEMVFGKEYRVLVLGEKVIAALEMIHPYITGDGVSSVRQILKQTITKRNLTLDKNLARILKSQGVTYRTILPQKKVIYIKQNSCLAEGGETRDVTDEVHPDVKQISVAASKAVGKYLVGIDIICNDISKKPTKKNFHILEINGRPDLYIHYEPTYGTSRNVLKDIITLLIKIAVPFSPKKNYLNIGTKT